jgi:hypothetical protein
MKKNAKLFFVYLSAAYLITMYMNVSSPNLFIPMQIEMVTRNALRQAKFSETKCPIMPSPRKTGLPILFISKQPCSKDTADSFSISLQQAALHVGPENVFVIDLCGQIQERLPNEKITVLDATDLKTWEYKCIIQPVETNLHALDYPSNKALVAQWFYFGYFAKFYQVDTFLYISSDTMLLADPIRFIPFTFNCTSLSLIHALSDHFAIIQKQMVDCVTKRIIHQHNHQTLLNGASHTDPDIQSHIHVCQQTLATSPCSFDPARPLPRMFARDHHLRSSHELQTWTEGPNSTAQYKRLLIQRGVAIAQHAATGRPVQLATIHLQGAAKRFHALLSSALRRTRLDPHLSVAFDASALAVADAATADALAAEAAADAQRNSSLGHTNPADAPVPPADSDDGPSTDPPANPPVPVVFSPVAPCAPDRRTQLLNAIRLAAAAVGAGRVAAIDAGGCVAGAVPAGVEVVPLESLLDGDCGAAVRELERGYLHLSSNSVALELGSMTRWLHLRCLARRRRLPALVHVEGDVLLLDHLLHHPPPPAPGADGCGGGAGLEAGVSVVSLVSAHASVLQLLLIECVAEEIETAYRDPARRARWNRTFHEGYLQKGNKGGICDMTFVSTCRARLNKRPVPSQAMPGSNPEGGPGPGGLGGQCVLWDPAPWEEELLFVHDAAAPAAAGLGNDFRVAGRSKPGPKGGNLKDSGGGDGEGEGSAGGGRRGDNTTQIGGKADLAVELRRGAAWGRRPGAGAGAPAVRVLAVRLGAAPAAAYRRLAVALARTRGDTRAVIGLSEVLAGG